MQGRVCLTHLFSSYWLSFLICCPWKCMRMFNPLRVSRRPCGHALQIFLTSCRPLTESRMKMGNLWGNTLLSALHFTPVIPVTPVRIEHLTARTVPLTSSLLVCKSVQLPLWWRRKSKGLIGGVLAPQFVSLVTPGHVYIPLHSSHKVLSVTFLGFL